LAVAPKLLGSQVNLLSHLSSFGTIPKFLLPLPSLGMTSKILGYQNQIS